MFDFADNSARFIERDRTAASVLLGALDTLQPALKADDPVLVVDDGAGEVVAALQGRCTLTTWRRFASVGQTATPFPGPGAHALATLRLPRSREALELALHLIGARLAEGAPVLVYGHNDEGIKGAARRIEEIFGSVEVVDTRKHCRVLLARRPATPPAPFRGQLSDWRRVEPFALEDGPIDMVVYPGIFAHGGLDEGTAMLLAALPDPPAGAHVLDFGCGSGIIGAALLRRVPDLRVQCLDFDQVAVQAARENVPTGLHRCGASWSALPAYSRYDRIVSNPPIHLGRGSDYGVLKRLVEGAGIRLLDCGELWIVVQLQVPVQKVLQNEYAELSCEAESTRFRVWRAAAPFAP